VKSLLWLLFHFVHGKIKKKYGKDFASFCRIMKLYFPDFIGWLSSLKDPRKFWTYETEVMLMTVIMKNVCCIESMQQMTDGFIKDECVKNLCTVLGVPEHEFLPHYATINEFLSRMDTGELEKLRSQMIHTLLARRKFEGARFQDKYWLVIFDATGLFHFKERHCANCLKKTLNKGKGNEQTIYYHHVLEAKLVLGDGFVVSIGSEFIENEDENVSKNDCETKAFKRLAFPDPLQGREHPVRCGGVPEYTRFRRGGQSGCRNSMGIPA